MKTFLRGQRSRKADTFCLKMIIEKNQLTSRESERRNVTGYKCSRERLHVNQTYTMTKRLGTLLCGLLFCSAALAECPDDAADLVSWTTQIVSLFKCNAFFFKIGESTSLGFFFKIKVDPLLFNRMELCLF